MKKAIRLIREAHVDPKHSQLSDDGIGLRGGLIEILSPLAPQHAED
jgi:hypothetical protein